MEVAALFATIPGKNGTAAKNGTDAKKGSRAGTVAIRLSISAEFGAPEVTPGVIPSTPLGYIVKLKSYINSNYPKR